jgi:hypothetical protein
MFQDVSFGQHDYIDLSDLNAKWDQALPAVHGLGSSNGSLSGNALGIVGGLGADPSYPWRAYSADTMALQKTTNAALRANGYVAISEDGKLGPATCGAVRTMCGTIAGGCTAPTTCQGFTEPTPVHGGSVTTPGSAKIARAGMMGGGGTNWLLVGGGVAAAAIGAALIFKKKRH